MYNSKYTFDYEPFYIGKGRKDRIRNTLYDKSPFKRNKIDKLIKANISIISIKVKDRLSLEESITLEKFLISSIGRRDLGNGILVNMTDGGDGGRLASPHSEEVKKKISDSKKGKPGKKHSIDTIKHMSDIQSGEYNGFYGMTHSEFAKNSISMKNSGFNHPMFGKKHSIEVIKKIRNKAKKIVNMKENCEHFQKLWN